MSSSLNTLAGGFVKDYSVVYKEKLHNGLWFFIIQRYSLRGDKNFYQSSSEIYIDAIITDGALNSWGNNVVSYREVEAFEDRLQSENFAEIDTKEYLTKEGQKYYNKIYNETQYSIPAENGKTEKRKSRTTKYVIEVDKKYMLEKVLNNGKL